MKILPSFLFFVSFVSFKCKTGAYPVKTFKYFLMYFRPDTPQSSRDSFSSSDGNIKCPPSNLTDRVVKISVQNLRSFFSLSLSPFSLFFPYQRRKNRGMQKFKFLSLDFSPSTFAYSLDCKLF